MMIDRPVRHGALMAAALLCASVASAQGTVRAGVDAWSRADYAAAVAIWTPLAAKGDADAQFNLGQAYKLGRGVPTDLLRAQDNFERAARQGHLDAQTSLGLLLFQNGNRTAAMRWLKAAADRGEPRAMLVLGTALFNGDGVPRDPVRAYALVSRSAAQNFGPAKETLADMDGLIPLAQRQKGTALALTMTNSAPRETPSPAKATPPAAKPAAAAKLAAKRQPVTTLPLKPAAPVAGAASGRWRIQLGAFGQRAAAEALYRRLAAGSPVAGHQPYVTAVGAMTRLQVGPFATSVEAARACAALSARGQPCFPVEIR